MAPTWEGLPAELHREIARYADLDSLKSLTVLDQFSQRCYRAPLEYSVRVDAYDESGPTDCDAEMTHESLEVDVVRGISYFPVRPNL